MSNPLASRTALFGEIAAASAAETLSHFRTNPLVDNKKASQPGEFDPVTIADKNCELAIRSLIQTHFPDDGLFGEEFGNHQVDAEYVWVIDPIDGTRAFISGVPLWGTLVGILHRGRPTAGAAIQPFIGEMFASDGMHPSWVKTGDPQSLRTRACASLDQAQLMTTTPALFSTIERPAYDALETATRAVRYGTDWYGYALVAAGCCDIVVESGLALYDVAALIPIIESAGGAVTNWSGDAIAMGSSEEKYQVVAVGDPKLLPKVLELLSPAAKAA